MKYITSLLLFLLSINVLGQSSSQQLKNNIIFPIEVFGKNGTIESVYFNINDASNLTNIAGLRLNVHGLTYTNKASVKVNNSPWYDINNKTNNISFLNPYVKASQGIVQHLSYPGLFSTYNFVILIPHTNFYSTNIIRFRFNDLNGLTIGYRILDMGVVNSNYTDLVLHTKKIQDDPSKWKPFSTNIANINNGSNKWFSGIIKHNGLPIKATCNDCHVDEGYDLKYFNYSNKSIVLRSTALHSLSLQDAQDIASFIRTRNVTYEEGARPWNPPYQPGPGLDSKPARSWAAGAGLQWVLTNDYDTITNIFPFGTGTNLVNYGGTNGLKPFNPLYSLNQREIPIVLPLPDWNRWLPHFHPMDIYPNQISNRNMQFLGKYLDAYNKVKAANGKVAKLTEVDRGVDKMYYDYYQRIQHNPNMDYQGQPPYYYPTPSVANYDNLAYISIIKWIMVKNFEFMNVYDLQDEGNVYSDPNWSDKRRWYKNRVFFTAPHVTGVPEIYPQWGSESASWYQLAQILNSGNRYAWDQDPLDQGYLAGFGNQFLPYKLYSRMPDQSIIWYKDWTNRTYGITMINTIKLLENSERGSNFPAPYKWPVYYLGYNPYGHMFGISQAVGEAVLFNYTDPQIQINWLSIWANKFYELVIRYSSNQWAEGEQSGNLYDALKVTETSLKNLKSQFGINITDDTINKVIAARKHIRPNLP